ncbi:MAG: hypothetical protein WCK27_12615, partial [Verrucomicrobiota bacterium]
MPAGDESESQGLSGKDRVIRVLIFPAFGEMMREGYLIVIDALDEAGEAVRNPLVGMLPRNGQRLPDWLGL